MKRIEQESADSLPWESLVALGISKLLHSADMQKTISLAHTENTPTRFVQALKEMYSGVDQDPKAVLGNPFPSTASNMIHIKDISFYSSCAHHMLPFFGKAYFAYIPNGQIVGLSKIPRLINVLSRRPQVQENLTAQIVQIFQERIGPQGCAVMLRAYHMCCMARGVRQLTSYTETTELRGNFNTALVKSEFLASVNSQEWKVF